MNRMAAEVEPQDDVRTLRESGIELCTRGFYQEALKAFQKALFLARETETKSEVYCDLGVVYRYLNQLDMADDIFQFILDHQPPTRLRVTACIEQAIVRLRKLDHQAALERIAKADEEVSEDPVLLTHLNSTYGRVYYSLYDFRQALGKFEKALAIIEPHQGASAIPIILNNIGDCHVQLGDFARGEEFILKALRLARERKNNRCVSECLISLMDAAIQRKDYEKAKGFGKKSLAIARSFKFADLIGDVEFRLANIYREEGEESISDFFFHQVLQTHRNLNSDVLNILAKAG